MPDPPPGRTGWPWTADVAQVPPLIPDERPWPRISLERRDLRTARLDYLPDRSLDMAVGRSYEELSIERGRPLEALNGEVARDRLMASWGWEFVAERPRQAIWRAGRKLWSAVSGLLSPSEGRSRLEALGYALIFVPVHLLATVGR